MEKTLTILYVYRELISCRIDNVLNNKIVIAYNLRPWHTERRKQ